MDTIQKTIQQIEALDESCRAQTQLRLNNLTKPKASLGRLEEIAKLLAAITRSKDPRMSKKVIFTLAADHGVTEEKVSAFPKEVTAQMVYNFLNEGAAINVLARHAGCRVVVVDMGVACELKAHPGLRVKKINYGTKNFTRGPAMSRQEAIQSIETGIEIFNEELRRGIDIVGTGEMGIGNTTASSAVTAVFTGAKIEEVTGRGTGINDEGFRNKVRAIQKAIELNKPDAGDPLDVLAKVGGFEIGGLAGVMLAAAAARIPVIVDGFISSAAALVAYRLQPRVKDYCIAAHCSVEQGHKIILDHIGLVPILDLGMRLGEGTGAALAMTIVEASVKILTQMASFESAGVSERMAE